MENRDKRLEYSVKYRKKNPQISTNNCNKRRGLIGDYQITKEEWILIMESCEWKCFYCNIDLNSENRSIDHWVPLSRGGDHDIHNLVAACKSCNGSKHDKLYCEWRLINVK